jgi:hypothetical protein
MCFVSEKKIKRFGIPSQIPLFPVFKVKTIAKVISKAA